MKKFMLIFIGPDYSDLGLSPEQMQTQMGKWFAWNEKLLSDGVHESGHALHPEAKVVKGSERTMTDRTSAELKELIGGYYIVKANDYNHAATIAEGYPDYDLGGEVEIREVMVFDR